MTLYIMKSASAELAWKKFYLSALELKRALDTQIPFDFARRAKQGQVLLVGEGNLSFSRALSRKVGEAASNITSTTFENASEYSEVALENAKVLRKRNVRVLSGVDATNLSKWFHRKRFELIVFQFPNVGSREPRFGRNPNHILVRRFLKSAIQHLNSSGRVAVTVVNSSHYDGAFDMDGAAERNGFEIPVAQPFYFSDYPGYAHVKTKEDGVSAIDKGDEFVTYVFRRKHKAAKNGLAWE